MIIVTGGTGLVGGHLLWHLLQEEQRIVATRRTTSNIDSLRRIFGFYTDDVESYLARIEWRTADVLDAESLQSVLDEDSIVYHCAALVSLNNNVDLLLDTNVIGTQNIVDAALKANVKKLCFVSSIAACGKTYDDSEVDENTVYRPNVKRSPYSKSKYDAEQIVWQAIEKGLRAVIVNPGVILGFSGNDSGSAKLFSQVNKGLPFYTNGGTGYVDVRDVARAMILLMKSDIFAKRFILVGENCSTKEVLSAIADGFSKRRPFISIGKKMLLTVGCVMELLGKLFHFTPLIDRNMARTSTGKTRYSNEKVKRSIDIQFTNISDAIRDICAYIIKEKKSPLL